MCLQRAKIWIAAATAAKEEEMTKKRLLTGVLAIALVFGMTVVGCEEEEPRPFFDWHIIVLEIPSNLNGENFTLSLIAGSQIKAVKNGVVAGGVAEANLVCDSSEGGIWGTDVFGRREWRAYLAIKIGNNAQILTKDPVGFGIAEDGTTSGTRWISYNDIFTE